MGIYCYHQNNSGGSFIAPAVKLIVEAASADEADSRAEELGVYFDDDGTIDCNCCGSRWGRAYGEGDYETVEEALEYLEINRKFYEVMAPGVEYIRTVVDLTVAEPLMIEGSDLTDGTRPV